MKDTWVKFGQSLAFVVSFAGFLAVNFIAMYLATKGHVFAGISISILVWAVGVTALREMA